MKTGIEHQIQTANILEIQRMSTEDGPGIRTSVFFKGCPLKCAWCHNPESISALPQVQWIDSRCIGCRTCLDVCPLDAIHDSGQGIFLDQTQCNGCGICTDKCPSTALELLGKSWPLDDLVRELVKDRAFFKTSQGGITLTGGDPTMQSEAAEYILRALQAEGVHTAIDTCGLSTPEVLGRLLPHSNLVLFDLKEMDPGNHRFFTGHDNAKILANIEYIAEFVRGHAHPQSLWIRTPVIPGATDDKRNIAAIGGFIASRIGDVVARWELCTFNNLCRDKYTRLGLDWAFKNTALISRGTIESLYIAARQSGVDPAIVHWSGSTLPLPETDPGRQPAQNARLHLVGDKT